MGEKGHCPFRDCERQPVARLDGRLLCREHFLICCYERIDRFLGWQQQPFEPGRVEAVRSFLDECTHQASALLETSRDLSNLERARLLDILARAKDLARFLRRSDRKPVAIPVVLRSDTPGRAWEEATETQLVSLHGAKLRLQHPVRNREMLVVIRRDTLQEVCAQVAWRRNAENGLLDVGIEFLNAGNFWQMEWSQPEPVVSRSLH